MPNLTKAQRKEREELFWQGKKRCTKCKKIKPISEFGPDKAGWNNLRAKCRECDRDYLKDWREDNREHVNTYQRQWRAGNQEKSKGYSRKWREKNPDYFKEINQRRYSDPEYVKKQRERGHKYYQADKARRQTEEYRKHRRKLRRKHRARETEYARQRRARIYGSARNFSHDDWLEILEGQDYKCRYCGQPFSDDLPPTVDHVWPLSKGGNHTAINIVAACKSCNARKHKKVPRQLRLPTPQKQET